MRLPQMFSSTPQSQVILCQEAFILTFILPLCLHYGSSRSTEGLVSNQFLPVLDFKVARKISAKIQMPVLM